MTVSVGATMCDATEALLQEVGNRFVLFPIRYAPIWNMYKKAESVFWTAEELDLSKDLNDWERLSEGERHFIKHILAFFAGSDGIVNENLGVRFMNEVKVPEARAFYGFQIAMENIHCVSGDTRILTKDGYVPIASVAGRTLDVWNGEQWSTVTPYNTSQGADLYRVTLNNGLYLDCTAKHKWFIGDNVVHTESLETGMVLKDYNLPQCHSQCDPDIFTAPFDHGKSALLPAELYKCTNHDCRPQHFVPMNYSLATKTEWLKGLLTATDKDLQGDIFLQHSNNEFLHELQLLLTTFGVFARTETNQLYIPVGEVNKLYWFGNDTTSDKSKSIDTMSIVSIQKLAGEYPTYCFEEHMKHAGVFNGILTGQSETYSLLIDTYIKDPQEKYKLLNAINTIPCIEKKANWAMKWIEDKESSFAQRLVAFACVEGIFFSGAFCAIFWMKERGMLPGLCSSNEFISRDEGLHTEFAVLLYSMLQTKLDEETIHTIVKEAVEIEDEFITESIPCHLLGMNSNLMSQYIKFVADRLIVQLGYQKVYNVQNPFDFMDRICLENKTNFFEDRVAQYSKANVGSTSNGNTFEFSTDGDF